MGRFDRPPSGTITYRGDLPPPTTTYASARANLPMSTRLNVPPSTNVTNSAVVNRRPRRNGLFYFYSHGGLEMPQDSVPRVGAGGVQSSAFQTVLVQLHDWVKNTDWFAAGYPRNLGYAFRVQQLATKKTGGPTSAAMQQRPIFPRVQTVQRYSVTVPSYPTKGTKS